MTESVVTVDWENGYVEASAKDSTNVTEVSSWDANQFLSWIFHFLSDI